MVVVPASGFKVARCLTKNVLESDSLPQIRMYSRRAELQALHIGGKEGGDSGPIDAREASDHQGDGQALQARRQEGARADARRALRAGRLQPQLRSAVAARADPRCPAAARPAPRPQAGLRPRAPGAAGQGLGDAGRHLRQAPGSGHGGDRLSPGTARRARTHGCAARAAARHVGGDHRPPAGREAPSSAPQGHDAYQAGQPTQEPDPGAHLRRVGPDPSRLRRDRPRRS